MYDIVGMHIGDAPEQLVDIVLALLRMDWPLVDDLQQILLDVLAHQINLAFLPERLLQLDDVLVAQHLEDLHLPQNHTLILFVTIVLLELLYRHQLVSLSIAAFEHDAIFPLANPIQNFVLVHANKYYQE